MNAKIKILLLFVLFCGTLFAYYPQDQGWRKTRDDGTIISYEKSGEDEILTLRVVALLPGSLARAGQLFRDISLIPEWANYVTEVRLIEKRGKDDMIFYERLDLPWPVTSRDLLVEAATTRDISELRAKVHGVNVTHLAVPVKKDCIRVSQVNFTISLEYIDSETTGMDYMVRMNPAGLIPAFLVNIANREYLYDNIRRLNGLFQTSSRFQPDPQDLHEIQKVTQKPASMRELMRRRLSGVIQSEQNLDLLAASEVTYQHWSKNDSGFASHLYLGRFEERYRKKAVVQLLEFYFQEKGVHASVYRSYLLDPSWQRELVSGNLLKRDL